MKIYLGRKTKIENSKSYDMSDVSLSNFIVDFDNLMNAILSDEAEKNGEEYEHTPYSGLSLDDLAGEAWNRVSSYNKPLPEVWATQIRNGSLKIESLQEVTNSATRMFDNMPTGMRYNKAADKDLANIVLAKKAMEEAKNQRSWISWLNPLNWRPYSRENAYLKELTAKVNAYRGREFPVDTIAQAYETPIFAKSLKDLTDFVKKTENAKPAPQKAPAKKRVPVVQPKEPEPILVVDKNAPISQQIDQIRSNPALCEPHYKAIGDIVAKYTNRDVKQLEGVIRMVIFGKLRHMEGQNALLEKANQGVAAIQKDVREMAVGVFKDLYKELPIKLNIPQGNHSSIAVVQEVTNYLMKNFSPVLQNPEKYGKYADNYVVKVESYLTEITKEAPGSWTFTAARDLLKIKPEEVMQEPEQIISEVEKEEPKQEEVVAQPAPEENEPEIPNNELLDSNLDIEEEENEEPVVGNESAEPQKPLGKMSKYMEEFDSENLFNAITDELYGETMFNGSLVQTIVSNNMNGTMEILQECAEKFDSAEQPNSVTMDEISLKVFDRADRIAAAFALRNTKRLVMAQKIANAMMRLASPVVLDEETYGKYADNYILSNDELLSKAGDYSDRSIKEAREELDINPDNIRAKSNPNENHENEIEVEEEQVAEFETVEEDFVNSTLDDEDEFRSEIVRPFADKIEEIGNMTYDDSFDLMMNNFESIAGKIKNYNRLFNESIEGEVEIDNRKVSSEEIMQKMTVDVFKEMYGYSAKVAGKSNITTAIVVAQVATDMLLKESSAARYNDSLEKYADNYLLKNEDILKQAIGVKKIKSDVLREAREKLNAFPEANESKKNAEEPIRENLGLKPEDLEKPAPKQEISAQSKEVLVKENNNLAK